MSVLGPEVQDEDKVGFYFFWVQSHGFSGGGEGGLGFLMVAAE